jgi:hypothetical protein
MGFDMQRFSTSAGIAIGPILFVIALLGILATVASSGIGNFGMATTTDRVSADLYSQANLIRSKINECYMQSLNKESSALVDNSEAPPFDGAASRCPHDPYPCSSADGTDVEDLTCPYDPLNGEGNQPNVWTGVRLAQMPPPTPGFNAWQYMNAGNAGGRCFWTSPISPGSAVNAGIAKVASKFSSQEAAYDTGSDSQKIVIFVTPPSGEVNENCAVP